MAAVRGRDTVKRVIAELPGQIEAKLLRGAARAGATVIAKEAEDRVEAQEVKSALTVKTKVEPGRAVGTVYVKGQWANSLAIWAEYGTDPHFISVDDSQRQGMSVNRINKKATEGSLVIGGKFVGATVFHPGARAHPFLRVSLDLKEGEATAAAQSFINARVATGAILGTPGVEGDGE